jgi:hypothetical protein
VKARYTRAEAQAYGLSHYFTGEPCGKGHVASRTVARNDCMACARERRIAYVKRNPEQTLAAGRAWYSANKEKADATRSAWREFHHEKWKADIRRYQAENADHLRERAAEWRRRNPDMRAATSSRRRALKISATPAWANDFYINEAYHLAKIRAQVCGGTWHVDHIVPLNSPLVCGLHCEANLQVIPGRINLSKANRYWPDMP